MKKTLLVEYKKDKSFTRTVKLKASSKPHVIGTARGAAFKVSGSDISPNHAGLEWRSGDWYVCDLASDSGTWVDKKSIVDRKIENELDVRIGEYDFKLKVIPTHHGYFNHDERRNSGSETYETIHEVVVKSNNQIMETHYLKKEEPFFYGNGLSITRFNPPSSNIWVKAEIGTITVQQRLRSKPHVMPNEISFKNLSWDSPHVMAVGGALFMLLAILFYPRDPDVKMPENLDENKYARIIYDSKMVQEKKKQAQKIQQKKSVEQAQGAQGTASAPVKGASQKTAKAISKIQASGLKSLLGRIASRANINAQGIQVQGQGTAVSAAANAFGGSVTGVGVGQIKESGESFAIGGVGTTGKGGGGTGYKGIGKLSQGEIGNAQVGMLDEEADISGGMDRDAIAEVIRKNIGQIRFCYERRLSAVPNLFGKVLVQFSIQDGGTVLLPKVAQSTLSDSVVEGCILRRIASWKFPSPPANMSVVVTYPFLFKSTQ